MKEVIWLARKCYIVGATMKDRTNCTEKEKDFTTGRARAV